MWRPSDCDAMMEYLLADLETDWERLQISQAKPEGNLHFQEVTFEIAAVFHAFLGVRPEV